jgi:opacity protein-like surface antigen
MDLMRYFLKVAFAHLLIIPPLVCVGGCLRTDYKGEHAILAPYRPVLRDGVYFGAGVGFASYRINQTVELLDFDGGLIDVSTSTTAKGGVGNVFLGYGQNFCWFYLGGEVFAKYTTAKSSFSTLGYHSDITARTSVGVSLLPGIKVTPGTLVYMRLGYDRTRFKISETGTLFGDDSRREWANAMDIGIGIEEAIYPGFSFRGEYTFTNFGDFRTEFNTKFSPKSHGVSLDFIYHLYSCF